jgi:hypothetical protein
MPRLRFEMAEGCGADDISRASVLAPDRCGSRSRASPTLDSRGGCRYVGAYAFLSRRLNQIRNMAPMMATMIVPIRPPA